MKHSMLLILTALLMAATAGWSQQTTNRELPFRMQASVPPYGLSKVKVLISLEQRKYGKSYPNRPLPPGAYDSLLPQEKFTYAMIHPESFAQNCSLLPPQLFEKNKIFSTLATSFYENKLSNRQVRFLKDNRDSVMEWIIQSVDKSKKMGVNYKNAVTIINGWEMIPYLIHHYKAVNDMDILTTLMLLMKLGVSDDFLPTTYYEQLYGKNSNYRSAINYSAAAEQFLLKTAMGYYKKRASTKG